MTETLKRNKQAWLVAALALDEVDDHPPDTQLQIAIQALTHIKNLLESGEPNLEELV
jgi:hypothetical protein